MLAQSTRVERAEDRATGSGGEGDDGRPIRDLGVANLWWSVPFVLLEEKI